LVNVRVTVVEVKIHRPTNLAESGSLLRYPLIDLLAKDPTRL